MSEWRPIKTAPKDGTIVLVYPGTWKGMTASPARWDEDKFAKRIRPFWYRIDAFARADSRGNQPTHWMPMPQPPVEEKLVKEVM